jgi:hypothetical protein
MRLLSCQSIYLILSMYDVFFVLFCYFALITYAVSVRLYCFQIGLCDGFIIGICVLSQHLNKQVLKIIIIIIIAFISIIIIIIIALFVVF